MSYDPQGGQTAEYPKYDEPPMQQGNRSKKWWLIGGCGCFTLLVVCCGGGIGLIWYFAAPMQQFLEEQIIVAESSDKVEQLLGAGVRADRAAMDYSYNSGQDGVNFVYRIPMNGEDNSGTLIINCSSSDFRKWNLDSMTIEVDGVEHPVEDDLEGLDEMLDDLEDI